MIGCKACRADHVDDCECSEPSDSELASYIATMLESESESDAETIRQNEVWTARYSDGEDWTGEE